MILVSGSLAYDTIMNFPGFFKDSILPDHIHMLNVSFLVEKMRKTYGGTAGNIAYTLALLGIKAGVIGTVGSDFKEYEDFLKKYGVLTHYVRPIQDFYTSTAVGIIDKANNALWSFYVGADSFSDQLSINDVGDPLDFGVISPNNPKTMLKFALEYTGKKIPYMYDPGMQLPYLDGNVLKKSFTGAKIIIGNDYEVKLMEKKTGIADLNSLARHGKIIITTLGEKGSRVVGKGESFNIPAAKVSDPCDPAGAGDAYRGGFVAGYLRNLPLPVCGRMGSIASAYTVEKYGTSTHYYTISEFEVRYKENFGEKLELKVH